MYDSDAITSAIIDDNSFTSSTSAPVDFIRAENPGLPITSGEKAIRSNNTFTIPEDNQRAVYLTNVGGWEISDCDINYTGTGNTAIQGTIGIVSFGCTDLFFRDNNIDAINPGAFYHGLMLSNTTASEACCTNINNGHTNMFFFGHSEGTTTRHTNIGNAVVGLDVWAGTVIGEFDEIEERYEHLHTGNKWNGSYNLTGARNFGNNDQIQASIFVVEGNPQSSTFWPPSVPLTPNSSGVSWFESAAGNASICDDDNFCPPLSFISGDGEVNLGQFGDHTFVGQFGSMLNWERDQYRLSKLIEIPDLQSRDNDLFNFVSGSASTALGEVQTLRDGIKGQFQYGQSYYDGVSELHDLEARLIGTYLELDSATNATVIEQLLAEKQIVLDNLSLSWSTFMPIKNAAIDAQKEEALNLIAENSSLSLGSIFLENEKAVNEIYLSKIVSESGDLTAGELAIIEPIAEQCVLDGGKVVYRARALYQMAESRWFDDDCYSIQALQGTEDQGTSSEMLHVDRAIDLDMEEEIRVYPNPAKQFLQIELPNRFPDKDVMFKLMDMSGKEQQTWKYSGSLSQQLDIRGLPAGTYWLNIVVDDYSFVNRRIVILP